ncbi:unnamed protein product [Closterium sp. NIES-54]
MDHCAWITCIHCRTGTVRYAAVAERAEVEHRITATAAASALPPPSLMLESTHKQPSTQRPVLVRVSESRLLSLARLSEAGLPAFARSLPAADSALTILFEAYKATPAPKHDRACLRLALACTVLAAGLDLISFETLPALRPFPHLASWSRLFIASTFTGATSCLAAPDLFKAPQKLPALRPFPHLASWHRLFIGSPFTGATSRLAAPEASCGVKRAE